MNKQLSQQLLTLGTSLVLALVVRNHYRRRSYPPAARYDTFGPRFWTGWVDSCVLAPITIGAAALFLLDLPRVLAGLVLIVQSLGWLLYTVVMHARYGATVGKMVTRVRVVDFRTEGNISWRQAWLREGIPMVGSLGLVGYEVFAILTGRMDPRARATHRTPPMGAWWLLTALPLLWFAAEVLTMLTNDKRDGRCMI